MNEGDGGAAGVKGHLMNDFIVIVLCIIYSICPSSCILLYDENNK